MGRSSEFFQVLAAIERAKTHMGESLEVSVKNKGARNVGTHEIYVPVLGETFHIMYDVCLEHAGIIGEQGEGRRGYS